MRKSIGISFLTLVLAGCATTVTNEEVANSWLGHDISELLRSAGPPDRITSDGKGGKIYVYEKTSTSAHTITNFFGLELDNPITQVETTTEYAHVFVDVSGKIYLVRWGRK